MACSRCEDSYIVTDYQNGDRICTSCGLVIESYIIDDSPEWSFGYSDDNIGKSDPSRCGAPTNEFFEKSSMGTTFNCKGNNLMKRLHVQMSFDYKERARWQVFEMIDNWVKGDLTNNVLHEAKRIYVKMHEKKISRGDIRKGLIACCIMYACKKHNVARSVKEISNMTGVDVSIINKAEKKFENIMKDELSITRSSTTVEDLISRFVNILNIPQKEKFLFCKQIKTYNLKLENDGSLVGKTPSAITASLIFMELDKKQIVYDKSKLLDVYNVSNVTVSKTITELSSIIY